MENQKDKWIRRIDWTRLVLAVTGAGIVFLFYFFPGRVDLDYGLSNIFSLYVFLMGVKTRLAGKNNSLAWFYMFFSAMMFIAVNMIWFRFGH